MMLLRVSASRGRFGKEKKGDVLCRFSAVGELALARPMYMAKPRRTRRKTNAVWGGRRIMFLRMDDGVFEAGSGERMGGRSGLDGGDRKLKVELG